MVVMALRCFSLVMLWNLSYPDHSLYQLEYSLCYPEYATPLRFAGQLATALLVVEQQQVVKPFLTTIQLVNVILMPMLYPMVAASHSQHHFMKLSFINSILVSMLDHHLSKF